MVGVLLMNFKPVFLKAELYVVHSQLDCWASQEQFPEDCGLNFYLETSKLEMIWSFHA